MSCFVIPLHKRLDKRCNPCYNIVRAKRKLKRRPARAMRERQPPRRQAEGLSLFAFSRKLAPPPSRKSFLEKHCLNFEHSTIARPKCETTYGFSRYKKAPVSLCGGRRSGLTLALSADTTAPPESCRVTRSKTGYNVCFSCVCCQGPGGGPAPNSLFRAGTVRVWQGVVYNEIARAVKSRCTEYAQKFYPGARLHSPPFAWSVSRSPAGVTPSSAAMWSAIRALNSLPVNPVGVISSAP